MTEREAYRAVYGTLVDCVPHYNKNWVKIYADKFSAKIEPRLNPNKGVI